MLEAYRPNFVGTSEGGERLWEERILSLGKTNGVLHGHMGDKKLVIMFVYAGAKVFLRSSGP